MRRKIGFKKLVTGFVVILTITLFSAIFSSVIINNNSKRILHVNNDIYPFTDKLAEFEQIVLNSKMLITNWVYLQYNIEDKEELKKLIKEDYPKIKQEILTSLKKSGQEKNSESLHLIFEKMDEILAINKELMNTLSSFDDYEDAQKIFDAEEKIEEEVIPLSNEIRTLLNDFINKTKKKNDIIRDKMISSLKQLEITSIIFGFGMFIIILLSVIYIQKNITIPVTQVHDILLKLSKGEIIKQKVKQTDDIIAEMVSALYKLSDNFNKVAVNAQKIGKGNFDTEIKPLSDKDILGNAILEMRNSLKAYSEEMEAKVRERTAEISRQKEIIEEKNKNITASINYAVRIQKASLPQVTTIQTELPDSFILFKPKDIVSGDFYWFSKSEDKIIIAAIDCTGHGIPGAFMSLIGINLLSGIVNENKITEADEILNELHRRVQLALKQDVTANQDGMDAALCVIDTNNKKVDFAGAKNPLVYIQNDTLFRIKGDKKSIGGKQVEGKFTKHTISAEEPTSFYIFSDGFQDQFGGKNGRKFMIKNMLNLFSDNHKLPFSKQNEIYDNTITEWKSSLPQTDDILIIGFKL